MLLFRLTLNIDGRILFGLINNNFLQLKFQFLSLFMEGRRRLYGNLSHNDRSLLLYYLVRRFLYYRQGVRILSIHNA